jgi:hypothetical protein
MRDLQLGVIQDKLIVEEDIYVDGTGSVTEGLNPSHSFLNPLQKAEQVRGGKIGLHLAADVEKLWLVCVADRLCFVEG